MGRPNSDPDQHQEIARRLFVIRIKHNVSQEAFGKIAGLSRRQIASIEAKSVGLRYFNALAICRGFNVSLSWLAAGVKPVKPFTSPPPEIAQSIPPRILLSVAYRTILEPVFSGIPHQATQSALTAVSFKGNLESVTPTLRQLIQKLDLATQERGSKATLASFLGVPPSRLSKWLSGKVEPSGSVTLRMLAWVRAQEENSRSSAAPALQTHHPRPDLPDENVSKSIQPNPQGSG